MSWIRTASGRRFAPLDPDPAAIEITDIAHALSNICRYTGHVSHFYSVAEHCVHVSRLVPEKYALEGLLHDASEAYLADIAGPVKPLLPDYCKAEKNLERAVATRFDLYYPWPEPVKRIDRDMLVMEGRKFMGLTDPTEWGLEPVELAVMVVGYPPVMARQMFMDRYHELT